MKTETQKRQEIEAQKERINLEEIEILREVIDECRKILTRRNPGTSQEQYWDAHEELCMAVERYNKLTLLLRH